MKKIISIILVVLFSVLLIPMTAGAYGDELSYVADDARLLSDMQQTVLASRAEELSNKYHCDVRIITVDDMADFGYSDIEKFSYYFYEEYNLGYGRDRDCVLLVLSMARRDYDFRVWGDYANTAFTLYGIDNMLDNYVLKELGDNNYNKAFSVLLDRAEVYLRMADEGSPFDRGSASEKKASTVVILILISLGIAGLICLLWRSQMKTAKIARSAGNYIPEGGFKLTGHGDIFMYRTVTRTKIQSSSSSGGGARSGGIGGSSGRSGKF